MREIVTEITYFVGKNRQIMFCEDIDRLIILNSDVMMISRLYRTCHTLKNICNMLSYYDFNISHFVLRISEEKDETYEERVLKLKNKPIFMEILLLLNNINKHRQNVYLVMLTQEFKIYHDSTDNNDIYIRQSKYHYLYLRHIISYLYNITDMSIFNDFIIGLDDSELYATSYKRCYNLRVNMITKTIEFDFRHDESLRNIKINVSKIHLTDLLLMSFQYEFRLTDRYNKNMICDPRKEFMDVIGLFQESLNFLSSKKLLEIPMY